MRIRFKRGLSRVGLALSLSILALVIIGISVDISGTYSSSSGWWNYSAATISWLFLASWILFPVVGVGWLLLDVAMPISWGRPTVRVLCAFLFAVLAALVPIVVAWVNASEDYGILILYYYGPLFWPFAVSAGIGSWLTYGFILPAPLEGKR